MKEVIKELYPEDYVLSIELFKKKAMSQQTVDK